jgi:DNA-directed RNA polymerase specialized sigma24 family protein
VREAYMRIEVRGFERLSYRERQVVALKESGLPRDAIAARLKLSVNTVATLYNRARSKGYEVVLIIPGHVLDIADSNEEGDEKLNES